LPSDPYKQNYLYFVLLSQEGFQNTYLNDNDTRTKEQLIQACHFSRTAVSSTGKRKKRCIQNTVKKPLGNQDRHIILKCFLIEISCKVVK
jgi:hypothetical protein